MERGGACDVSRKDRAPLPASPDARLGAAGKGRGRHVWGRGAAHRSRETCGPISLSSKAIWRPRLHNAPRHGWIRPDRRSLRSWRYLADQGNLTRPSSWAGGSSRNGRSIPTAGANLGVLSRDGKAARRRRCVRHAVPSIRTMSRPADYLGEHPGGKNRRPARALPIPGRGHHLQSQCRPISTAISYRWARWAIDSAW